MNNIAESETITIPNKNRIADYIKRLFENEDANTNKNSLRAEMKRNWQLYALMFPFMFIFFGFVVLPMVSTLVLSFTNFNLLQVPDWIGLMNYVRLFIDDDIFIIALKNTLLFAVFTGPISYLLCFLVAWFVNEMPRKVRTILTLVFYMPTLSTLVYFIWQFLFSGDTYGLINGSLMKIGFINEPIQWLRDPNYNLWILMIVQLWMCLGTSFLAFIAGLQSVDETLYEAGDVDGITNRYQELFYITIPSIKPQLLFGAVMQIAASFSVSTISMQLCGFPSTKYSAHTLVLHILDYGTIRYEMGYACAISVILFAILMVVKKLIDLGMRYINDS